MGTTMIGNLARWCVGSINQFPLLAGFVSSLHCVILFWFGVLRPTYGREKELRRRTHLSVQAGAYFFFFFFFFCFFLYPFSCDCLLSSPAVVVCPEVVLSVYKNVDKPTHYPSIIGARSRRLLSLLA